MHTRASPFLVWVMAMCCVSAVAGRAHELETDRLTVIQREPNHLALTLRIDEIALMQRLLAPGSTRNEFLLACVALPPEALENKLSRARTLLPHSSRCATTAGELSRCRVGSGRSSKSRDNASPKRHWL